MAKVRNGGEFNVVNSKRPVVFDIQSKGNGKPPGRVGKS